MTKINEWKKTNLTARLRQASLTAFCLFVLYACERTTPPATEVADRAVPVDQVADSAAAVTLIADRYYATTLETTPEIAYFSGVELMRHDSLEDNSPASRKAAEVVVDEMLDASENNPWHVGQNLPIL